MTALWLAPPNTQVLPSMRVLSGKAEYTAAEEAEAAEYWEARKRANPGIFDGPVWMVSTWNFHGNYLILNAVISSYKYVLYTHFSGRSINPKYKALGASAITKTADGFILLGLRSGNVATTPNIWHFVPAGNVDRQDLCDLMATELHEELGLQLNHDSLRVFGVFDAGKEQGNKTEIVFVIQLGCTLEQVKRKFEELGDHEHERIEGVKEFPENLKLTEIATAALTAFFRYK